MSTLTDLRRTLERHADDVADPVAAARTAAVHHRIAVVRRRRRAVGTGAVALALVVGATVVARPRHPGDSLPAAPVVLGQTAPTTKTSLGYTYRTDGRGEAFGRTGSVTVKASTEPQLYSWTTDGAKNVRVTLPDGNVMLSTESGFRDFVVLTPGERGRLTVHVDRGRVGLASYALSAAAPDGETRDGVTYRAEVAGSPLLAAAVPAAGTTDVRTSYVAPDGRVGVHVMCSGVPDGDVVNISFDGHARVSSGAVSCDDDHPFDPGSGGFSSFHVGRPGSTVTVRAWVSHGFHDPTPVPAGSAPAVRMGVGVYGPLPETPLGGYRVASVIEQGGHTWRVAGTRSSAHGSVRVPPASYDRYAEAAWDTRGPTTVEFRAGDSTPSGAGSFQGGQAGMGGLWIPAGSSATLRLTRGTGTVGLAIYERVDQ
jgi:hypothetical protein